MHQHQGCRHAEPRNLPSSTQGPPAHWKAVPIHQVVLEGKVLNTQYAWKAWVVVVNDG